MNHTTNIIVHTMAFVTPIVEHWLERQIGQRVHYERSTDLPVVEHWLEIKIAHWSH